MLGLKSFALKLAKCQNLGASGPTLRCTYSLLISITILSASLINFCLFYNAINGYYLGFDYLSQQFKLNPGAKTFSPSYTNPSLANPPAAPMVTSMGYAPNDSPLMPVGTLQLGNGLNPFGPHSSVTVKGVPYGNLSSGNGVTAPHLLQPVSIFGAS